MTALLESRPAVDEERPVGGDRVRGPSALRRVVDVLVTSVGKVAAIVLLLAVWETAPRLGLVDATFLPPFSTVVDAW